MTAPDMQPDAEQPTTEPITQDVLAVPVVAGVIVAGFVAWTAWKAMQAAQQVIANAAAGIREDR